MIEHIPDVSSTLSVLRQVVRPGGFVLVTVPNAWTASETFARAMSGLMNAVGRPASPGVAHVVFKGPAGWRRTFEAAGFEIAAWDMTIGPLVNTWNVLKTAPVILGLMVLELLKIMDRETRHTVTNRFERSPAGPFGRALARMDKATRSMTAKLHAWNLVVLRRPDDAH